MENSFTAVFEKEDNCCISYIQELPSTNLFYQTLEEARESLHRSDSLHLNISRQAQNSNPQVSYVQKRSLPLVSKFYLQLAPQRFLPIVCLIVAKLEFAML